MSTDKAAFITRWAEAWARLIVKNPDAVLITLLLLGAGATYCTSKLDLESDQLKLINQELTEVKDVQRIIDMVGGAGYLMMGLRSDDPATLKKLSDALNERLLAEKENVRFITYKVPVEFVQENMVLFVDPAHERDVRASLESRGEEVLEIGRTEAAQGPEGVVRWSQ